MDNNSEHASEHRGVPERLPVAGTSTDVNARTESIMLKKPLSFSNTVKASLFPRKEEAIVYPAVEGLLIKDYVIETGKKVGPKNIRYVSRMSNNRVCIYFSSRQIVDQFIEKDGGVTINDIFVAARKLIMPAKRIIVSNISPCIPHHVLEDKLKELNVKLVSPISFLGAGIGLEDYKHVLSFRRQVFVAEETIDFVPSTMVIKYDSEECRVFLSDDQMRCFKCKEVGHIAAMCTSEERSVVAREEISQGRKRPPPSSFGTTEDEVTSPQQEKANCEDDMRSQTVNEFEMLSEDVEITQNEGNLASGVTTVLEPPKVPETQETTTFTRPSENRKKVKNDAKRIKVDRLPSTEREEDFHEIQSVWNDGSNYTIDFVNFTEFLRNVRGSDRPIEVARRYTNNIEGLVDLIKIVKPLIAARATKERCRRLIVALKKALILEGNDTLSPPLSRSTSQESISSERSSY